MSSTDRSTTSPPGLARSKRGGAPSKEERARDKVRQAQSGASVSQLRMVEINVPSFIAPPCTSSKYSNSLRQTTKESNDDGKEMGNGSTRSSSKNKSSRVNRDRRNGSLRDEDDIRTLLRRILQQRQYNQCDQYAMEIQNSGDDRTEKKIRQYYLRSTIIDEILACLTHRKDLTASLLAVLPYVSTTTKYEFVRDVSAKYCSHRDFHALCPALSSVLILNSQAVSTTMKTWILHALADISEAAGSGSASSRAPIADQYNLVYASLQILQCPRASPQMQAFAIRVLTCELNCGVSARQHLCELVSLPIVIKLLPTLTVPTSHPTTRLRTTRLGFRHKLNGTSVPFEDEEQDMEVRQRISSSSYEQDMEYYLQERLIKYLYLCYSHEEFWYYDEPLDAPKGSDTSNGYVRRDKRLEQMGVWTKHYFETLENKCLLLESYSPDPRVRAAAAMILDYPLERKKRNSSIPAVIREKYLRNGSIRNEEKESEDGTSQETVTVSASEILGKVDPKNRRKSGSKDDVYFNRRHHHHSLRHFGSYNRPPAWDEKFKAYVKSQLMSSTASSETRVSKSFDISSVKSTAISSSPVKIAKSRSTSEGPPPSSSVSNGARKKGSSSTSSTTSTANRKTPPKKSKSNGATKTSSNGNVVSSSPSVLSNSSSANQKSRGKHQSNKSKSSGKSGGKSGKRSGKRKSRR